MCEEMDDNDSVEDVFKVIEYLPLWIRPNMVYPEDSIEVRQLLGSGHYGSVYKGLFRNGNAVYVFK